MLALRAFAVGHFAAKLAWSFLISLSNPSREKKKKKTKNWPWRDRESRRDDSVERSAAAGIALLDNFDSLLFQSRQARSMNTDI
jgi:hypothetical protein